LAYDTTKSVAAAKLLHSKGNRSNLFIKIPGTSDGIPAIEESISNDVPINVTLLFSREQYLASAEAYMRGLERRVSAGLSSDVRSVASVFLSRWDGATIDKVPDSLRDKLGIAIGHRSTIHIGMCSTLIAGNGWPILALVRNVCSLRAPVQKTQRPRMFSTSTR
jgi:transaldolase